MQWKMRKRGFTLVELMVTLTILGVMLGTALPGLHGYLRLSQFRENEETACALFLLAQSRVTDLRAGGSWEDFALRLQEEGIPLEDGVYAAALEKGGEPDGDGALVTQLLGEMEGAAVCIEIDTDHAQVRAVYYSTACRALVYGQAQDGQTSLDRLDADSRQQARLGYCGG